MKALAAEMVMRFADLELSTFEPSETNRQELEDQDPATKPFLPVPTGIISAPRLLGFSRSDRLGDLVRQVGKIFRF